MLSNGWITDNFCWSLFAISLWLEFLLLVSGSNTFRDMLIDSILQFLGCTAHVPTITVAHVLIHDHTLLCGGQDILMDSRKNLIDRKNDAWIYCFITLINCWFGKLFKFLRHFANPREPKVDGAFLRSFFLCWIKFRDFLWNAGVDYISWWKVVFLLNTQALLLYANETTQINQSAMIIWPISDFLCFYKSIRIVFFILSFSSDGFWKELDESV